MGNETVKTDTAILEQLNEPDAIKILVTLDEQGTPHPTPKGSLHWDGERIVSWEILESSRTNRNLTRAIWFEKPIAILLLTSKKQAYKIAAKPIRNVVAGKEFTRYYEEAQQRRGRAIAGVWFFEPTGITDQTPATRIAQEQKAHPYFVHLDQLAAKEPQ
ncbi:MAG: pyridoxamine 5'-phosphate oxidase family protein [Azoarcus sp.]|jgi:hypothetical protein|nr:pyridoxamine 5'-phosphate oxidase family protein [Azoarcus sp.]